LQPHPFSCGASAEQRCTPCGFSAGTTLRSRAKGLGDESPELSYLGIIGENKVGREADRGGVEAHVEDLILQRSERARERLSQAELQRRSAVERCARAGSAQTAAQRSQGRGRLAGAAMVARAERGQSGGVTHRDFGERGRHVYSAAVATESSSSGKSRHNGSIVDI